MCATETRRRLITSSSFAVGWLHLDGPVHLEKERKEREGKSQVSTKTIGAICEVEREQVRCGGFPDVHVLNLSCDVS